MQEAAPWGMSHTPQGLSPAALNHLLKELVLPVALSLTLDKLELWKKANSGGELSSFLLALVTRFQ